MIYGRAVGGGGGGFKYILIAYCETGTVITAEKGDMSYTETSENGTAVLVLPEGGIWMVYVDDDIVGEEFDFEDEITIVYPLTLYDGSLGEAGGTGTSTGYTEFRENGM